MLPGFRFLFAAIVLSMSILVFGLGAAALLRAAHEEFASTPTWRAAPETVFAQPAEAPRGLCWRCCASIRLSPTRRRRRFRIMLRPMLHPQRSPPRRPSRAHRRAEAGGSRRRRRRAKPENPVAETPVAETTPAESPAQLNPPGPNKAAPAPKPTPPIPRRRNQGRRPRSQSETPRPRSPTPRSQPRKRPRYRPIRPNLRRHPNQRAYSVSPQASIAATKIATLGGPAVTIETPRPVKAESTKPGPNIIKKRQQARRAAQRRRACGTRTRDGADAAATGRPVRPAGAHDRPQPLKSLIDAPAQRSDHAGPVATGGPSGRPHSDHEPS